MTAIQMSDLIQPDGATVLFADSGFPLSISGEQIQPLEEVRVKLLAVPAGGYALGVWTKGTGTGPQLVMLERVLSIEELSPAARRLTLETSGAVEYSKSRKCGCGSRLRSYRPWGDSVRVIATEKPAVPWAASPVAA